jgi:predicted TIM-barrel fold metal-dependent hydrolase
VTFPDLYDANCRIGRVPWGEPSANDVPALLRRMDLLGIRQAVVSHTVSWRHDPATGNALVLRSVADQPRLLPCWVAVPDTCGEVPAPKQFATEATEAGVAAVRVYPREHGFDLDGPDFAGYLGAFAQAGLPLIVDLGQSSWAAVEAAADPHPGLALVVCETGYRSLRRAAGVLERRPNVYLDLSDLSTHEGLEWLCETFGPGRLVFGTGAPLRDAAEAVTRLLWSDLDDAAVRRIGSETLRALLPAATR